MRGVWGCKRKGGRKSLSDSGLWRVLLQWNAWVSEMYLSGGGDTSATLMTPPDALVSTRALLTSNVPTISSCRLCVACEAHCNWILEGCSAHCHGTVSPNAKLSKCLYPTSCPDLSPRSAWLISTKASNNVLQWPFRSSSHLIQTLRRERWKPQKP